MSNSTWNRIRGIVSERCWKGYKPVKGKKPYSKGSCEKIAEGTAMDKMLKAIDDAFSPENQKKMKADLEAKRNADPKFQEWKKRQPQRDAMIASANKAGEDYLAQRKAESDANWKSHKEWLAKMYGKKK